MCIGRYLYVWGNAKSRSQSLPDWDNLPDRRLSFDEVYLIIVRAEDHKGRKDHNSKV